MVFYYDLHRSIASCFLVGSGTVTGLVLSSWEFWGYLFLHGLLNILVTANVTSIPSNCKISWDIVEIAVAVQTFVMVFFLNTCYERYVELYSTCMSIDETVKVFAQHLTISFNDLSIRKQLHVTVKHVVTAVFSFYFGVTNGAVSDAEWAFIMSKGLVDKQDLLYLKAFPGHRGILLVEWAMRTVAEMLRSKIMTQLYSPPERAALMNRVMNISQHLCTDMRDVADILALPIPFAYWHLLNVILSLNFVVVGYTLAASSNTILLMFPYGVYLFVFMGLRVLCAALSDPFRDATVDPMGCAFPVVSFLNYTFDHAVAIVASIDAFDPEKRLFEEGHGLMFQPAEVEHQLSNEALYREKPLLRRTNKIFDGNASDKVRRASTVELQAQRASVVAARRVSISAGQPGSPTRNSITGGRNSVALSNTQVSPRRPNSPSSRKGTVASRMGNAMRGQQTHVAYKWEPNGLILANHEDSYLVKWIQLRGFFHKGLTIEKVRATVPPPQLDPDSNSSESESPSTPPTPPATTTPSQPPAVSEKQNAALDSSSQTALHSTSSPVSAPAVCDLDHTIDRLEDLLQEARKQEKGNESKGMESPLDRALTRLQALLHSNSARPLPGKLRDKSLKTKKGVTFAGDRRSIKNKPQVHFAGEPEVKENKNPVITTDSHPVVLHESKASTSPPGSLNVSSSPQHPIALEGHLNHLTHFTFEDAGRSPSLTSSPRWPHAAAGDSLPHVGTWPHPATGDTQTHVGNWRQSASPYKFPGAGHEKYNWEGLHIRSPLQPGNVSPTHDISPFPSEARNLFPFAEQNKQSPLSVFVRNSPVTPQTPSRAQTELAGVPGSPRSLSPRQWTGSSLPLHSHPDHAQFRIPNRDNLFGNHAMTHQFETQQELGRLPVRSPLQQANEEEHMRGNFDRWPQVDRELWNVTASHAWSPSGLDREVRSSSVPAQRHVFSPRTRVLPQVAGIGPAGQLHPDLLANDIWGAAVPRVGVRDVPLKHDVPSFGGDAH
eukprot:gnl/MRDRNA2_/MRDRNA2_144656_c0_seq1.p1 gnl/MRDRNA2_/MRDRNA2_144656_c0~~gnl/MRDRNA2_/MRDRNA2_144656_c0_seq1.p1  ORF type:complete len:1003 (-),score=132.02 gnl/MRDRNA2_/MRDRNA2_144656_c0_seq1:153-3161(-)